MSEKIIDAFAAAMRKAYNLGQTYWQQADSDYMSQQKKSDITAVRFIELNDQTCAELRAAIAASGGNAAPEFTDERAAFEADTLDLYPVATFNRFPNSDTYNVNWIQEQWGGWQRRAEYAAATTPNAALVAALQRIARWHGEFPEVKNADGTKSSYSFAYGSNGQRDYMRQVALDALSAAGVKGD